MGKDDSTLTQLEIEKLCLIRSALYVIQKINNTSKLHYILKFNQRIIYSTAGHVQCSGSGKISSNYRITRYFGPVFSDPVHGTYVRHFGFVRQMRYLEIVRSSQSRYDGSSGTIALNDGRVRAFLPNSLLHLQISITPH